MAGPRSSQIYPYISYGRGRLQPYSEVATTGSMAAETAARIAADNALQTNINLKADIASPTFTGDPKAPTPATADNDTSVATTAFVKAQNYVVYPTWTTGSVAFATSSTVLGQDNANLFWDNTNHRLGIGTTAPANKLTVQASAAGTVVEADGGNGGNANVLLAAYGGTAAVFLKRFNNTQASPSPLLANDAIGQIAGQGRMATVAGNSGFITIEASENWSDTATGSRLKFATTLNTTTTSVDRLRIEHNGNVGIGKVPATTLDIAGFIAASGAPATGPVLDATACQITVANGSNAAIGGNFSGLIILTSNSNGDTGVYVVGGGGAVLIGTSASTWVASTASPAAGRTSVYFNGGAGRYSIANNFGSSVVFGVAFIGTRASV